jgi:D-glycero-D-manno-heptose 1,7-bisphosphate phosphatase
MGRFKSKQAPTQPVQFPTSKPESAACPTQQMGMPPQQQMGQQGQYNQQDWPTSFPKPMVGIDRDGVIIEWKNIIKKFEDVKYINGSLEAIRKLRLKGHKMMMFADQPNIYRGLMNNNDVENIMNNMMNQFGQSGIFSIDGFLYNQSDMPQDPYAKPNVGMLARSKNEMGMDWTGGYYVGDTIEDVKMAIKFGVTPVLVRTGKGAKTEKEYLKGMNNKYEGVKVFDNLLSFVDSLDG